MSGAADGFEDHGPVRKDRAKNPPMEEWMRGRFFGKDHVDDEVIERYNFRFSIPSDFIFLSDVVGMIPSVIPKGIVTSIIFNEVKSGNLYMFGCYRIERFSRSFGVRKKVVGDIFSGRIVDGDVLDIDFNKNTALFYVFDEGGVHEYSDKKEHVVVGDAGFSFSDIEQFVVSGSSPKAVSESKNNLGNFPSRPRGRTRKFDWDGALIHLIGIANYQGLPEGHGAQAAIVRMMAEWFQETIGDEPDPSEMKRWARRVLEALPRE